MYKESAPPPIYALIVGIGQYRDSALPAIANAAADAQALADLLTKSGAIDSANLRLLRDAEATARNLDDSLIWLAKAAPEEAIALFYYVGHGLQVVSKAGGCRLCFYDSDTATFAQTSYSVRDLTRALGYIRARNSVILLDCANLPPNAAANSPLKAASGLTDDDYRQIGDAPGRAFLAAARSNEPSFVTNDGHSLFNACLLDVLAGSGVSVGDRLISVRDVISYVNSQISRLNPAQHPYTVINGGDFNLLLNPRYTPDSNAYNVTPSSQDYGGVQGGVHNYGTVSGNVNNYYGNNTNISTGDVTTNNGNTIIGSNISQSFFPASNPPTTSIPNVAANADLSPSPIALNTLMRRYFDEDNFRTLCQIIASTAPYCTDLDYNGLAGSGWQNKILSLYDFCRSRRALGRMVDIINNLRPDLFGSSYSTWQSWASNADNSLSSAA